MQRGAFEGDVLGERRRARRLRGGAVGDGLPVQGEQVGDEGGQAPAVQDDVAVGEDEPQVVVGDVVQVDADQRGGGQVEAGGRTPATKRRSRARCSSRGSPRRSV